jgi:hypothetical protein
MQRGEGLVGKQVPSVHVLCEDAVGNVVRHRAQDIALQGQVLLHPGLLRNRSVEPPCRIVGPHHRGDGSHNDIYRLVLCGMELGEKGVLHPLKQS